jgi:ABC-type transport system involved in multi-copper enzyme maturation permease subunit
MKSEMLKLFSGKMLAISMSITFLLAPIGYVATIILMKNRPEDVMELFAAYENMSAQGYMLLSLSNLMSGGTLFIITAITTALLFTGDYSGGTMKYALLSTSRSKLILSKTFASVVISLCIMASIFTSSGIIAATCFSWSAGGYGMASIIGVYLLGALTLLGFSCLLACFFILLRKTSGAIGLGIAVFMVLGLAGILVPESLRSLLITVNFPLIIDMQPSLLWELFLIGSLYSLGFTLIAILVFRRRDIFL